ncbi:MAG: HPr family phosphocarrier protein [Candidatus Delongbacteria bacterium]|nr:HPr family phosphocarrier protein [Candidatus Delongbacteria bacterium]MCG2760748.1 HPr family phosphocarrier protein [Candidatus Delongbacteria bacterium]
MLIENIKIINSLGLHARPAAQLVKITSRSDCEVFISRDDMEVNAKSIMGVMMLAAEQGSTLTVKCDGPDESDCMNDLKELIKNKFYEE